MKICFENVNFTSNSGPNNFAGKLRHELQKNGHTVTDADADVQLSFIESFNSFKNKILRLDGIYFNTEQDWENQNSNIKKSYKESAGIVVQSYFNLKLVSKYFGNRSNVKIIHNGTCLDIIKSIPSATVKMEKPGKVWLTASSWRPHKRLNENIRLFHEFSEENDMLLVAGANCDSSIDSDRVKYIGNLQWNNLISVMKLADNFIHTAWLDHCPNVVVDAKAAGCKLYCTNAGGTSELASEDDVVIIEDEWDFKPCKLYQPPELDFSNYRNGDYSGDYGIKVCHDKYLDFFSEIIND